MKDLIKQQNQEIRKETGMIKEENLNEMDLDKIKLPSNIERFTDKLINQIKRVNLTKPRQYALVGRIIAAVGIDITKLSAMMSIIKRDMKNR